MSGKHASTPAAGGKNANEKWKNELVAAFKFFPPPIFKFRFLNLIVLDSCVLVCILLCF